MTIQDYVKNHAAAKPNADIVERWESRVVAHGMHLRGRAGAEAYLGQFGRGLKGPKAIGLARIAEIKGCQEMANRFWEEAYFLDHGARATLEGNAAAVMGTPLPVLKVKEGFGRAPQLPVVGEPDEIEARLLDDAWGIQEKIDGRNIMIDVVAGKVAVGNKKGLTNLVSLTILDAAAPLGDAQIDAEDVAGICFAFDAVALGGEDLRERPYVERHEMLGQKIKRLGKSAGFRFVPLVTGRAAKTAFVAELRARKAEGFILKCLDAPYEEGKKHGNQLKHQFRATNAFVVGERNGQKNSVQIYVFGQDGTRREVGNLTVPANRAIPAAGTVVEVRYLYCHPGAEGKLHQPTFETVRDDVAVEDCRFEKLKIKADAPDDGE